MARDAIGDARPEARLAAARVLERTGEPGLAAEICTAALTDPRADIRLQAATDLLRMSDESNRDRGYRALVELGRNPSPQIRQAAVAAHRNTDNPTLPLVTALGDDHPEVRLEAAAALLALL